jgi:hypothetical protein
MSEVSILIGLRLPPQLNDELLRAAQRHGIPRNTLIKIVLAGYLASGETSLVSSAQVAAIDRAVALVRKHAPIQEAP